MRIVFFGNNRIGHETLKWLAARPGVEVAALVLHPESKALYREEMLSLPGMEDVPRFEGNRMKGPETLEALAALDPRMGVSSFYSYIFTKQQLSLFPDGIVNLHPGYLPWNRGRYPNVWSIVDRTPAGATLHYVDEGVDTGDIIARKAVEVLPHDTGETLYRRLEEACLDLFKETWPLLETGRAGRTPQDPDEGSFHLLSDVESIDEVDLSKKYEAGELIDILRARTFPPHEGAYFVHEGRKVRLSLRLDPEDEG